MPETSWPTLEPDVSTILDAESNPLKRLADGDVSAVIVRQVFPAPDCRSLVQLLIDQELIYASNDPRISSRTLKNDVVGKYLGRSVNPDDSQRKRIDLGVSLENFGDDKDQFFQFSTEANRLFDRLFTNRPNPITAIYDTLQKLAARKHVVTAYEPDGREYGAAILRIHYGGFTYGPHFDSVRNREHGTNYAVHRFDQQLAGVLCVQNTTLDSLSAQGIIHHQFWNEEIDQSLKTGRFHDYAAEHKISSVRIELQPGDLYFFNTGLIHEVPGVVGDLPCIVLAIFIGYSDHEDEVMVWS